MFGVKGKLILKLIDIFKTSGVVKSHTRELKNTELLEKFSVDCLGQIIGPKLCVHPVFTSIKLN